MADKRRRRAITWPFASPGNPPPEPILIPGRVITAVLPKRRGIVLRASCPQIGNPPAVAFAWRQPVISGWRFRPRRAIVTRPPVELIPPPNLPRLPREQIILRRPLPRRALTVLHRFASPGNPTPQPIIRPSVTPPRFSRRPGRVYLATQPSPGDLVVGPPPSGYTLTNPQVVDPRRKNRLGRVIAPRFASPGGVVITPPPSSYVVTNPQVVDPRRKNRLGRVLHPAWPLPGNIVGKAKAPVTAGRTRKRFSGSVYHPAPPPYVFTQPTPPQPPIRIGQRADHRRPGQVIRPRLLEPQGGGTAIRGPIVLQPRRPARRGAVIQPSSIAITPDFTAAYHRPNCSRPRPRRGVVVQPRQLANGDTNRTAWPSQPVRPRFKPRRGVVIQPTAPAITPDFTAAAARVFTPPKPVRRGIVSQPRLMLSPGSGAPLRAAVVCPPRRPARAGRICSGRILPPTAGSPQRMAVVQPVKRLRPGRVFSWQAAAIAGSEIAPAVYPDPFSATSNAG
jgi:hypothetical protein